MRRLQLIEFHEEPWYPEAMREIQREILHLANEHTGFAAALSEPFLEVLRETGASTVLDLCSGAGGPIVLVVRSLEAHGVRPPKVLLSDLYPNVEDWRRLRDQHPSWLDFVEEPLDATSIPGTIGGDLVTIVNALHHFPAEGVRGVIEGAVRREASIFIAEGFPRSVLRATAYLPSLLRAIPEALRTTSGRKLEKILLSFSVLPVTGGWDWLASALRIHEPAELVELGRDVAPHYRWRHDFVPFPPWGRAVYAVGVGPG